MPGIVPVSSSSVHTASIYSFGWHWSTSFANQPRDSTSSQVLAWCALLSNTFPTLRVGRGLLEQSLRQQWDLHFRLFEPVDLLGHSSQPGEEWKINIIPNKHYTNKKNVKCQLHYIAEYSIHHHKIHSKYQTELLKYKIYFTSYSWSAGSPSNSSLPLISTFGGKAVINSVAQTQNKNV